MNDITSLEAFCCETLEFLEDSNTTDLRGEYIYEYGTITNGRFFIDLDESLFVFTTENNTVDSLLFSLDTNTLEVWTFENGNRIWTTYRKTENN